MPSKLSRWIRSPWSRQHPEPPWSRVPQSRSLGKRVRTPGGHGKRQSIYSFKGSYASRPGSKLYMLKVMPCRNNSWKLSPVDPLVGSVPSLVGAEVEEGAEVVVGAEVAVGATVIEGASVTVEPTGVLTYNKTETITETKMWDSQRKKQFIH